MDASLRLRRPRVLFAQSVRAVFSVRAGLFGRYDTPRVTPGRNPGQPGCARVSPDIVSGALIGAKLRPLSTPGYV